MSKNALQAQWWKVRFSRNLSEEEQIVVMELGARGIATEQNEPCSAYFLSTQEEIAHCLEQLDRRGLGIREAGLIPDKNWVAECAELVTEIDCEKFRIIPWLDSGTMPAPDPDKLFVVPGLGFGTGHHATTRMCLSLLEALSGERNIFPPTVLDFGTGSALLAVAVERLFNDAAVLAIDIDPLALENARDNLKINRCNHVQLACASIGCLDTPAGGFGLIAANLYAQVLEQSAADLGRLLCPGACLIISGMRDEECQSVLSTLEPQGLYMDDSKLGRISRDGWSACLLRMK